MFLFYVRFYFFYMIGYVILIIIIIILLEIIIEPNTINSFPDFSNLISFKQ